MRSVLGALVVAVCVVWGGPLQAQKAPSAEQQALGAAIAKSNAVIALMNRTLRAVESWTRYTSWVNLKTGPTGRERYIDYGLYGLYDVRDEIAKARAAAGQPPLVPELDATVLRYVAAYEALAPLLTAANGYYERKDYKSDKMAEGKLLHEKMVPAAQAFLAERAAIERHMQVFKSDIDKRALAAIEAEEGKSARWHVKNVMVEAGRMMQLMPSNAAPVVDLARYDERLAVYAAAVKELDLFAEAYPGKFSAFEGQPRSLLGKLRDLRDKLGRAKGDARRGGGGDLTWIVNEYNMMVSSSEMATRFGR